MRSSFFSNLLSWLMEAATARRGNRHMNDMILILNYSDEFSVEIARRLRAEQIYSRIISGSTTSAQVREIAPRGVILSGEAGSAPGIFDAGILELGIPVLAMGYAAHMLLAAQGGASADVAIQQRKALIQYGESVLFKGVTDGDRYLQEALTLMLPPDVQMTASAGGCTIAFEHSEKKQYGVQFELERNDPEGSALLINFARDVCGCSAWWSLDTAMFEAEERVRVAAEQVGSALCAVSGGVDSAVAALMAHRAFGERMKAIFVDTGLMREGEVEAVRRTFDALGVPLLVVDCQKTVMTALNGKLLREEKRTEVTRILHDEMMRQSNQTEGHKTLVLGTNYSDFLHTGSGDTSWAHSGMTVVEPLLELFKEEVRAIAARLGFDESMVSRKPFPALGLGARIIGEVTQERLQTLRMAEAIFREEIEQVGMERKLYKYFPILVGDRNALGGEMLILRAVTLSSGMLMPARLPHDLVERTVQRIMEKQPALSRVFYDETPTPEGRESFS